MKQRRPRAGRRCSHDGLRPRLYMSPAPGATARAILRPECAIQAADRAAAPVGGTPGGAGPRRRARSPVSGRPGRCSAAGRGDRHLAAGNDRGVGRGPVAAAATDARCGGPKPPMPNAHGVGSTLPAKPHEGDELPWMITFCAGSEPGVRPILKASAREAAGRVRPRPKPLLAH
jgi:hypothetical protein